MASQPNDSERSVIRGLFEKFHAELVARVTVWTRDRHSLINKLYLKWDHKPPTNLPKTAKEQLAYITKSLYNEWRKEEGRIAKQRYSSLAKVEDRKIDPEPIIEEETIVQCVVRKGNLEKEDEEFLDLYTQGCSGEEIAEELGITVNQVRVNQQRIMRRLRKTIKREDIIP